MRETWFCMMKKTLRCVESRIVMKIWSIPSSRRLLLSFRYCYSQTLPCAINGGKAINKGWIPPLLCLCVWAAGRWVTINVVPLSEVIGTEAMNKWCQFYESSWMSQLCIIPLIHLLGRPSMSFIRTSQLYIINHFCHDYSCVLLPIIPYELCP